MDLKDIAASLATRLVKVRGRPDLAKEATKNEVILPLLSALGFDVFDPTEVFTAHAPFTPTSTIS